MKKYSAIFAVLLAIMAIGCTQNGSESEDDLKIRSLRSKGEKLNSLNYHPDSIKPREGVTETFESLRYVDTLNILCYYMDYCAKVDWDQLIGDAKDKDKQYTLYGGDSAAAKSDKILYVNPPHSKDKKNNTSPNSSACSGFVCHNPQNELLFCRNYDGDKNPLVVVFNKAVKPGEYKSVMMTELPMAQMFSGLEEEYGYDSCLLEKDKNLDVLLRQPSAIMDGMNERGLCIAAYQLPNFRTDSTDAKDRKDDKTLRPMGVCQSTGKPQITTTFLHRMILSKCATVQDVVDLFRSHDYITTMSEINIHWCVADSTGAWATLEFWKDKNGKDSLYVMNEKYRQWASYSSVNKIPYEYRCIENYYCNEEAARTYNYDYWQHGYSTKQRVLNMMRHYSPVMTEGDALRCLQYGNFGIETIDEVTDWSCVYNPKDRTILFNMRDDLSIVYCIDLEKDLKD